MSTKKAPLRLVLFDLLHRLSLNFRISSRIQGHITLHLVEADPFEIFDLILVYYRISLQENLGEIILLPHEQSGTAGYRVRSAP
ncbi:hypothetical protein HOF92_08450 [bacterium]|nr:hypothetical protein [bacterium]